VRLRRELDEAREQQAATADVLKVISRSTFDLRVVLDTLIESAARLCEADTGLIRRREGDTYPIAATFGVSAQQREHFESYPTKADRASAFGRAILKSQTVHIPDVLADPEFDRPQLQSVGRFRAVLAVPLMREGAPIGALGLMRSEPRPFTDKQIELVTNFAAQAVIAIENTRALSELRQRTTELSESLEQQTATSKVLEVISSSPGDLKPVFEAILANAVRLCGAKFGNLYLREGNGFRVAAMHNAPPAYAEQRAGVLQPSPHSTLWQVAQNMQPAQTADMTKLQAYVDGDPWLIATVSLGGHRGVLSGPMLHEDELIGIITIFRQEAGAFAHKQIELLTNFAKQAVIAIENTRLLNELRESLQQQTATADVLKVISTSASDLEPVFDAILDNATQICEAKFGTPYSYDGNLFRCAAIRNAPKPLLEFIQQRGPFQAAPGTPLHQILSTRHVVHRADDSAEAVPSPSARLAGAKSYIAVPMFKDEVLVGAIVIYRQQVRPFTEKQIALVENFALQAVIAIENARLLHELRDSLLATDGHGGSAARDQFVARRAGACFPEPSQQCDAPLRSQFRPYGSVRRGLIEVDGTSRCRSGLRRIHAAWAVPPGSRNAQRSRSQGPRSGADRRFRQIEGLPRPRSSCGYGCRTRWSSHHARCPDAEGERADRYHLSVPARGPPVYQ
jgi:GAF domain-containing protein